MKILILNGSPRAKGNISQMLDVIRTEAERLGAETETIAANKLNVKPCIACMRCRCELRCSLPEDDAQMVLRKIQECDGIVIGAPCYWGNMPGTMKLLFDRMVYGLMGLNSKGLPIPLHKGKRCILISTSTTPWPFNIIMHQSRGAIRAMKEICHYSGFKVVAKIEKGGTRHNTTLSEREKNRCRKAAKRLIV